MKLTITSRELRHLPAGQIQIYHIIEQTDKPENEFIDNGEVKTDESTTAADDAVQNEENDNPDQSISVKDDSETDANIFFRTTGIPEEPEQAENQQELVNEGSEADSESGLNEDELSGNDDAELTDDSLYEIGDNIISPNRKLDIVAEDGTQLALEPLETIEIADTEDSITFEMKEFSGVAVVRLNGAPEELLGAGPSTDVETIDTSETISINMFNYWA